MAEIYHARPSGKNNGPAKKGASGHRPDPKNPKKKLSPLGRFLVALAIIAGVALLLWGGYHLIIEFYNGKFNTDRHDTKVVTDASQLPSETVNESLTHYALSGTQTSDKPSVPDAQFNAEGLPLITDTDTVMNILLIGIDARAKENEAGLSDTMMILSINKSTKSINLVSIERDLVVKVPGKGYQKLNSAHALGRPELLLKTLKENFNIDIHRWARINFFSFVDVVNAVGGLDVEMTASEIHYMNFYLLEINELYKRPQGTDNLKEVAGTYHLNGYQTLAFCRNRYTDSDFGRMERQRKVIDLIMQKARRLNPVQLNTLLTTVLPLITTNIEQGERHDLLAAAPTYLGYTLNKSSVPERDDWYGGNVELEAGVRSVVLFKNKKQSFIKLYTMLYGVEPQ